MKKFISRFIFIVCILTSAVTSASQQLNGVWVLDTDRTIKSLKNYPKV